MTDQIPDTCTIDGRTWVIEETNGPNGVLDEYLPSNEELGVETVTQSTANWSGRIDHFLVHEGELYLFKLEVTLPPGQKDKVPKRARKETRTFYMPYSDFDSNEVVIRPETITYLVFDDLKIKFSGSFIISFSADIWDQPWPVEDDCPGPAMLARLDFDEGIMVDQEELDPELANYVLL